MQKAKPTAVVPTRHEPEVLPAGHEPALADLPAGLKPESARRLQRIVANHHRTVQSFQYGAALVICNGLDLIELRKETGHGKFNSVILDFTEKHGVTRMTAYRYIERAEVARRALAARAGGPVVDPGRLLGDGSVDEARVSAIADAIAETTNATNWRELLEGFGLSRERGRGGFHPPRELLEKFAKLRKLDVASYQDWDDEVKEEFRAWAKAERHRQHMAELAADPAAMDKRRLEQAEKHWSPFLKLALIGTNGKDTWSALPRDTRSRLADTLLRFAELIKGTL